MPRRPARIREDIPLWLIPQIVQDEIARAGEEMFRIVIKKTGRHYFNVATHTRSVKRELRPHVEKAGDDRP